MVFPITIDKIYSGNGYNYAISSCGKIYIWKNHYYDYRGVCVFKKYLHETHELMLEGEFAREIFFVQNKTYVIYDSAILHSISMDDGLEFIDKKSCISGHYGYNENSDCIFLRSYNGSNNNIYFFTNDKLKKVIFYPLFSQVIDEFNEKKIIKMIRFGGTIICLYDTRIIFFRFDIGIDCVALSWMYNCTDHGKRIHDFEIYNNNIVVLSSCDATNDKIYLEYINKNKYEKICEFDLYPNFILGKKYLYTHGNYILFIVGDDIVYEYISVIDADDICILDKKIYEDYNDIYDDISESSDYDCMCIGGCDECKYEREKNGHIQKIIKPHHLSYSIFNNFPYGFHTNDFFFQSTDHE